jgi:antitoxin VapB
MTMGMQLNIKSEDAHRLASELAALTGESLTSAVTEAIRERLHRMRQDHGRTERMARIRKITAEIREAMGEDRPTSDHGWLYDERTGLPV